MMARADVKLAATIRVFLTLIKVETDMVPLAPLHGALEAHVSSPGLFCRVAGWLYPALGLTEAVLWSGPRWRSFPAILPSVSSGLKVATHAIAPDYYPAVPRPRPTLKAAFFFLLSFKWPCL